MTFGKRLKKLRTDTNITQLRLSEILGTAKSNISKYESDTIEPNFTMLSQLSELFHVPADYLLGISDNPNISSTVTTSANGFLCERLKKLLSEDPDLNDEFYASVSKIPIDTFRRYISGDEVPGAYELCKLVEAFDTSADYLFGKSDILHPDDSNAFLSREGFPVQLRNEMDGNYLETELAEEMDLPISSIKALLSGEKTPDSETLFKLAQIFKKSTDYLLGMTEHSRKQDIDGNYPFVFDKRTADRIANLMDAHGNNTYWADFLSITEDEVDLLKNYGFIVHVSVLSRLAEMLHVSMDYLSGRTDAQKTLDKSEESFLLAYRNLNEENRSIAYGEVLKLKKEQEREEYMRSSSPVAAEDDMRRTGTDGLGK